MIKKLSNTTFLCAPLSTRKKLEKFQSEVTHKNIKGYALLDQIRVLDVKRLLRRIGFVEQREFEIVIHKLKELL